jgi:hypothetical protein
MGGGMRAQFFVELAMRAFREEVDVHLAEQGREAIGVFDLPLMRPLM